MRLDLVLVKGPLDLPRRLGIPLKSGKPTVVGRSPESDVRLEPQMSFCSGTHARFHFTRPRSKKDSSPSYFVTDAGSSNGTFVNEVKISSLQATKLEHGDRIILGGSHGASEKILVLSLRDGVHVPFVEDKIFAGNRTIAFNVEDARGIGRIIDAYYSQYRFPRLTELNERDAARLAPRSS